VSTLSGADQTINLEGTLSKGAAEKSACSRSLHGAQNFCRLRSYQFTVCHQGVSADEAMMQVFYEKTPTFMMNEAKRKGPLVVQDAE